MYAMLHSCYNVKSRELNPEVFAAYLKKKTAPSSSSIHVYEIERFFQRRIDSGGFRALRTLE